MGVPKIHLEQTFGPFGEKPGRPFFFVLDSLAELESVGWDRSMMKNVPIFFITPGQESVIETS